MSVLLCHVAIAVETSGYELDDVQALAETREQQAHDTETLNVLLADGYTVLGQTESMNGRRHELVFVLHKPDMFQPGEPINGYFDAATGTVHLSKLPPMDMIRMAFDASNESLPYTHEDIDNLIRHIQAAEWPELPYDPRPRFLEILNSLRPGPIPNAPKTRDVGSGTAEAPDTEPNT